MAHEPNYNAEADRLIHTPFPGYQGPLKEVSSWLRRDRKALPAVIRVLEHLRREHRYSIKVAQELVLAYLLQGARSEAESVLVQLVDEYPSLDEETHCRLGRLYREIGDDYLKAELLTGSERRFASQQYEKAWLQYDQGFGLRGSHYPGINRAALFLLRAWSAVTDSERQAFLEQVRQEAQRLLAEPRSWKPHLPDDNIWLLASRAEAQLLLSQWDEAIKLYRKALAQVNCTSFYRESMGGEVRRLLRPLCELLHLPDDRAEALCALFPPSPVSVA